MSAPIDTSEVSSRRARPIASDMAEADKTSTGGRNGTDFLHQKAGVFLAAPCGRQERKKEEPWALRFH